jgi:HlyD family secretion protein
MSKGKKILVAAVVVVAIAGAGFANMKKSSSGKADEVRMEKIEKRTLVSTVRAPGRVQPSEYVNLSAQVPGRIVELAVEEGDTVVPGQLLIRLDDTQYRASLESARASVKSAEATMRLTRARVERARQNLERQKKMAADNLVSPEAIEIAETELEVNAAELAARAEDKARAEAQVRSSMDDLSKTVYLAPTGGVISKLNVKQGEIVITGTMNNPGTVILTIADRSGMQVEADVDETDVVDIRPGQEVTITVDALPDTSFPGLVTTIAASAQVGAQTSADAATNFQVKVLFSEDIPQLRPGMTADVEIKTASHTDVMAVPIAALAARDAKALKSQREAYETQQSGGGKAIARDKKDSAEVETVSSTPGGARDEKLIEGIFVVKEGVALFRNVRTGIADDTHIEVVGDLEVGQEIVAGPYKTLRELKHGAKVKPLKEGGKGPKKSA